MKLYHVMGPVGVSTKIEECPVYVHSEVVRHIEPVGSGPLPAATRNHDAGTGPNFLLQSKTAT